MINNNEDPADRIIRATIAKRKENLASISKYTADFYSRGVWKVRNAPEKILGQSIRGIEGSLDSSKKYIFKIKKKIK